VERAQQADEAVNVDASYDECEDHLRTSSCDDLLEYDNVTPSVVVMLPASCNRR